MAPREILDSEDDGSDFSEDAGLGDVEGEVHEGIGTEMPRDEPHENMGGPSHSTSTGSTDPSFFQHIYDQQQALFDAQSAVPDSGPDPVVASGPSLSSAPPPGQEPPTDDSSFLTPVADLAPPARGPRGRTRGARQTEVIDLTDIATPSQHAAGGTSDVWDVPGSAKSQRAVRTYGKRKAAQLGLEQGPTPDALPDTQDPYAFPDATPPTRATKRRAPSSSAQQPPDSSPVMLLPTEAPPSSDRQTRSSGRKKRAGADAAPASSMPDTAVPSLYVTQSTLTASQKQEYRIVSLSSEAAPREAPDALLAGRPTGMGETCRSSDATIAYPTPSLIGSSRRTADVADEMGGADGIGFQSSPDVLNDMTTSMSSTRSRRSRIKVVSSAELSEPELEAPAPVGRTKRRKVVRGREASEDLQGSNRVLQQAGDDGDTTGTVSHTAVPAETDGGHAPAGEVETIDEEAVELPAATPQPAAKRQRGRKKKGSKGEPASVEPQEAPPAEAEPEPAAAPTPAPEPPAKRKRGRPRKSEASKLHESEPLEPQITEDSPGGGETEAGTDTPAQPFSELQHNSQHGGSVESARATAAGESCSVEKENGAPAAAKEEAATTSKGTGSVGQAAGKDLRMGAAKVQYRVGLSRKSRIAPLLKSLKKPE